MEDDEDSDGSKYSYGAGGSREKKSKKSKKIQKPIQKIGLKEEDEKYPTDIPEKFPIDFDWGDVRGGVIRDVINQGNRRTCWTVASSRSLSAHLVIGEKFDPPVWLSALHLLVGLIDKIDATGWLNNLEHLQKFLIDYGAVLEEECACPQLALEYKKDGSRPKPVLCTERPRAKHTRTFKVRDLIIKDKVDESELIRLVKDGPVAASIDVYDEFTDFKGDGIYEGPKKGSDMTDKHMFLVYGYGTKMPERIHYWKVQNSAGSKWGDKGFGKIIRQISRGKGAESLFTCIVYPKLLDHYEGQKETL